MDAVEKETTVVTLALPQVGIITYVLNFFLLK